MDELKNKPILLFEKLACKFHVRKWYLLPLPLIILYLTISLIPNIVLGWVIGSLEYNKEWFIITVYTLYMVMIYKRKFFGIISNFENSKQIPDNGVIKQATAAFTNRWTFVGFLIFFEVLFYGEWIGFNSPRFYDIAGFFIAIVILPVGAEIFSAFLAGAILPRALSKGFKINILHPDGRGGLKPIADLLLYIVSIYFIGVFIVALVYPPFFASIFGIPFIVFGFLIFFLPQFFAHNLLSKEKNTALEKIERKYVEYLEQLNARYSGNSEKIENLNESDISNLKNLRDEIRSMSTWPFDLSIMSKYVCTLAPVVVEAAGINFYGVEQFNKILSAIGSL